MAKPTIMDAYGRPIRRESLTQEIAAPRMGTVRNPTPGYQADGLTPVRLAAILRAADMGQPRAFLELAETIEERDPHYLGVLGTRRRCVSQLDITVEAGSEDPEDEKIAQMVRNWIDRDALSGELFAILDCIGKGYSGTEVVYEISAGQYRPRLIPRDPRIFRFDLNDLETPLLLNPYGQPEPMEPGHFIWATIKAKSGIAARSGLARVAAWGWMFKAYTVRDWAIFRQTYGTPIRLGKYATGASEADKQTLLGAVRDIAGDCAAVIPDSMTIEFVEAANVGASHQVYKEAADWIDQQISKAVLGQTSTTDAVVGGLGSGKEHREVQKSIERADAKALAAILNRDLIQAWVQLEYGPRKAYPRLRIGAEEATDLKAFSDAVGPMIDRGMEVDMAEIRAKFNLSEPKPAAKLMRGSSTGALVPPPPAPTSEIKRFSGEIKRVEPVSAMVTAPQAEGPLAALPQALTAEALLADRLAIEAGPAVSDMFGKIEAMLEAAGSFEEFRAMLTAGFPKLDQSALADVLERGMLVANLTGQAEVKAGD